MAVYATKEDLISGLKSVLGDNTSDEAMSLETNLVETFENFTENVRDTDAELKELDENWRKRYKEAFYSGKPEKMENVDKPDNSMITIDDLFKGGK